MNVEKNNERKMKEISKKQKVKTRNEVKCKND